jgi:phospholipid/cholesterol/gamma-HCH transport system substrate-binding protein
MAAEDNLRSTQNKAGVIALVSGGILTMVGAVLVAAYALGLVSHGIIVTSYFENAYGLKTGAAVNVNGVTVGTVRSVDVTSAPERKKTPVQVTMELTRKDQAAVHTDSLANLINLGALADTVIDIDSEHATGPPIQDGDELKTLPTPSVLNLKAGQATVKALNETENRFNAVVDQMETGKGTIGQFITNPGFANELSATARKVQQVTAKLGSDDNSAGKLLNDHDLTNKFAAIGTDMQGVSASVTKLTNGPLQANLSAASTRANSLIAGVNSGQGAAGMLVKNPKQLTGTFAQASALVTNFTKNPATGGNFAAGGATAVDLKQLQSQINDLTTMIRKNPKQYLTIQFRIF